MATSVDRYLNNDILKQIYLHLLKKDLLLENDPYRFRFNVTTQCILRNKYAFSRKNFLQ